MIKPQLTLAQIVSLQAAYREAVYEVYVDEAIIELAIGDYCPQLDSIITKRDRPSWALITAHNPYSQCLSVAENQQRQQKLLEYLAARQLSFLAAVGKDKNNLWTPEASLLILNVSRPEAIAIGHQFEQNAILYGEPRQPVELLWIEGLI